MRSFSSTIFFGYHQKTWAAWVTAPSEAHYCTQKTEHKVLPPTSPYENSQDGLLNTSSEDDDSSDEDGTDSGKDQDDEGDQEDGDEEEDPDTEDTDNTGDTNDAEDVIDTNSDESEG
jgi:hypothetical protein